MIADFNKFTIDNGIDIQIHKKYSADQIFIDYINDRFPNLLDLLSIKKGI